MTLLKEFVETVRGLNGDKATSYVNAEGYYEGTIPETFASGRLRQAMRATGHRGQHNYCRVVTDAVLNRLEIANILGDTKEAIAKITEVWDNNELTLESKEVHRRALEYGDCYVMVWPNEDGELLISYNSPRTVGLRYDPENPRKKLYAVKIWQQEENLVRMNVYYADKTVKYSTIGREYTEGSQWSQIGTEDNPFGEIPVFHFRTHRPYGKPEHIEGWGPQNDINKLLATHFYTIDYQGAPQRYALSMTGADDVLDFDDEETDRQNQDALHGSPGTVWYMKNVTQVGQFNPVDPKVFWGPIESLKESMAALTDTPYHFLNRGNTLSSSSAQRVAEAPLLKKVADRQKSFETTWSELFKFVLRVEGVAKTRVVVKWDDVESFDSLDVWDVMLKKVNAGLSRRQALREMGYEESEIEKIMAERDAEMAAQPYQRAVRTSTDDNENFGTQNGMTEAALKDGGRGKQSAMNR